MVKATALESAAVRDEASRYLKIRTNKPLYSNDIAR